MDQSSNLAHLDPTPPPGEIEAAPFSEPNRTTSDSMSRGASANLDFLRTTAVLMVLFDHLTRHYHFDRYDDIGFFGVLLFFVHTSLVLMYSMQRSNLRGFALLRDFYIRRFFRIYPLSILSVLTAVALHLHADGRGLSLGPRPGALELVSNLFLIQNLTYSSSIIGPLWSLPLEVQMYLLLPFLFMWKTRSFWRLLALWLVCGILGHFPQTIPALAWFTLLIFVPNFLPGIIAFTLPENRSIPSYLWPPFILLLGMVFLWMPSRRTGGLLCLLLGVAVPRFKDITFRPLKLISHRIATYSYGIYLGHSFFIWFGLTRHNNWILFWLMWLIIPVVLYHAFEHPLIEIGRKLAERVSERSRASTSLKTVNSTVSV
jgi:peptidoglycan/LPS O-acetylase OafA/YrhL